jgi:hypothetical protein
MASTGVVPGVGTLARNMVKTLDHTDLQGRVQLFEYHPEGGTHGTGTDKQHIYSFSGHMSSPFDRKQWDSETGRKAFGTPDRTRAVGHKTGQDLGVSLQRSPADARSRAQIA